MRLAALLVASTACAAALPETHLYQLTPPLATRAPTGSLVVAIEPFVVEAPYDDARMVYRPDRVELSYYNYHRWSSQPGALLAESLARSFEATGQFGWVARDPDPSAPLAIGGRLLALEEVDAATGPWLAHVDLQVRITETATGRVVWSRRFDESEPIATRGPAGLARAVTIVMDRIAAVVTPVAIAELRDREPSARSGPNARR